MRYAPLLLALALAGCAKKPPPAPSTPATPGPLPATGTNLGGNMGTAAGGQSITLLGAIRDAGVRTQVLNDLGQMGKLFQFLESQDGKGPATVAEWAQHRELPPRCKEWLTSGDLQFYPNVRLAGLSGGAANTVVVYFKQAPQVGGPVVFADGRAAMLTAEQFNAAPKPQ